MGCSLNVDNMCGEVVLEEVCLVHGNNHYQQDHYGSLINYCVTVKGGEFEILMLVYFELITMCKSDCSLYMGYNIKHWESHQIYCDHTSVKCVVLQNPGPNNRRRVVLELAKSSLISL